MTPPIGADDSSCEKILPGLAAQEELIASYFGSGDDIEKLKITASGTEVKHSAPPIICLLEDILEQVCTRQSGISTPASASTPTPTSTSDSGDGSESYRQVNYRQVVGLDSVPDTAQPDPAADVNSDDAGPSPQSQAKVERGVDRDRPALGAKPASSREQVDLNRVLDRIDHGAKDLTDFIHGLKASLNPGAAAEDSVTTAGYSNGASDSVESAAAAIHGKSISATLALLMTEAIKQPAVFANHYSAFARELMSIISNKSSLKPEQHDHRFRDRVWKDNAFYRGMLQIYLASEKELHQWIVDLQLSREDQLRAEFLLEQIAAACAPSNSPLNPAAVKRAYQTGGESVVQGVRNLAHDLLHNGAMPRQVRQDAYTLGSDIAITKGAVVYRNPLYELIQYMPQTDSVQRRPCLLIPPQINKFYVFDLSPNNSVIKYLLEQGLQVFVVSWRMPGRAQSHWGLESYIRHLEDGINVMRSICASPDVNLISACAGGLTSMAMLAYFEAAQKPLVHAHALLVTSPRLTGRTAMELFVTRESMAQAKALSRKQGIMSGKHLAKIFAWLRPVDLVWNFWVNNYLMGKEPPSLEVLYWDNDPTNLPAALHNDFVDMYAADYFVNPGSLKLFDYAIDFKSIRQDMLLLAGDADYLMPWQGCYETMQLVSGKCEFILSNSGHIQSVLRPPGLGNSEYFCNSDGSDFYPEDPQQWRDNAQRIAGSWWTRWSQWMQERSGTSKAAPTGVGSEQYPALCAAPGEYVLERAD